MRAHILQHSDGTPPGTVVQWLQQKGIGYEIRCLHKGDQLPSLSETDLLVILGGPMNVDDVVEHPWLTTEKDFLKKAIHAGKACLGLCLGGQMLAQTLGARVGKNQHWEVGWHPVKLDDGRELIVFQWHQDTFSLPPGSKRMATNAITENQAFRYGENVIGIQFHPEATKEWVKECAEEKPYPCGPFVQPQSVVLDGEIYLQEMRDWFFRVLENWPALNGPNKGTVESSFRRP
jgi:GMP synthase-like glutamine amidotransferase